MHTEPEPLHYNAHTASDHITGMYSTGDTLPLATIAHRVHAMSTGSPWGGAISTGQICRAYQAMCIHT